ncbi:hypothetical protein [Kitasatospora sp. NPDC097643]|uniref:hypothetical protein n=1 Tax=Kitasatospora sp. NPDC097643 TaxID=3157230 RepID=UPI003324EB23
MTASGLFVGSPEYTAPERARGRDGLPACLPACLPASDLFSLGATLFQAVEGLSPFRRESLMGSLTAVLLDEPSQLTRADRPLDALITALLTRDPDKRPGVSPRPWLCSTSRRPTPLPLPAPLPPSLPRWSPRARCG